MNSQQEDYLPKHLGKSERKHITDSYFRHPIGKKNHQKTNFTRVSAQKITFNKIDFKHSKFSDCYFRDCTFITCDFTGCQFTESNFRGSKFDDCHFDYAIFSRTFLDTDILESRPVSKENLQLEFARSLRLNFQGLGDSEGVNRAMEIELNATEKALRKAWSSTDPYHQKKYPSSLSRIKMFGKWAKFKILDFVWGNGEKIGKLIITTMVIVLLMTVANYLIIEPTEQTPPLESYGEMIQVLLGVTSPQSYPATYLATIYIGKLILFGASGNLVGRAPHGWDLQPGSVTLGHGSGRTF